MTTKTTADKLAAAQALVAKYEQELRSEALVNNIEIGDDADFIFGRGESKKTLTGKVVVPLTDGGTAGKVVGVEAGEGFDKKVYKVRVTEIIANRTADARNVLGVPANDVAPVASEDPLLAA